MTPRPADRSGQMNRGDGQREGGPKIAPSVLIGIKISPASGASLSPAEMWDFT